MLQKDEAYQAIQREVEALKRDVKIIESHDGPASSTATGDANLAPPSEAK